MNSVEKIINNNLVEKNDDNPISADDKFVPVIHPSLQDDEQFLEFLQEQANGELDINEIFNGLPVRIIGSHSFPMFYASDIGKLLKIQKIGNILRGFSRRDVVTRSQRQGNNIVTYRSDGKEYNRITLLTEFGVYKLCVISKTEFAEQFQAWMCYVLYNIRNQGKFIIEKELQKTKTINETLLKENGILVERTREQQQKLAEFKILTDTITVLCFENDVKQWQLGKCIPEEDRYEFSDDEFEFSDEDETIIDKYDEYAKAFPEDARDRRYSYKVTLNVSAIDESNYERVLNMYVKDGPKALDEIRIALYKYSIGKDVYSCDREKLKNAVRAVCLDNK